MRSKLSLTGLALCISLTLSAQAFVADSVLYDAYQREDMSVWKDYIDRHRLSKDSNPHSAVSGQTLLIEYGYCGYIVAEAKKEGKQVLLPEAKQCVQRFKSHISDLSSQLPAGHYEMYRSAVYVYELRLHESIHPVKAMSLAKEAVRLAQEDPLVLSYYGTCLFYAPKPFGSKQEALQWFEKAQARFDGEAWRFCWVRAANEMYIEQCHDKLK